MEIFNDFDFDELKQKVQYLEETSKKQAYHIQCLKRALMVTPEERSLDLLIVDYDWTEDDLSTVEDIFEYFDNKKIWTAHEFESEFMNKMSINYQSLKPIINTFYTSRKWVTVCVKYVKSTGPCPSSEYNDIVNDIRKNGW